MWIIFSAQVRLDHHTRRKIALSFTHHCFFTPHAFISDPCSLGLEMIKFVTEQLLHQWHVNGRSVSSTSCDLFFTCPQGLWCTSAFLFVPVYLIWQGYGPAPYRGRWGLKWFLLRSTAGVNPPKEKLNPFPSPKGNLSVCLFSLVSSLGSLMFYKETGRSLVPLRHLSSSQDGWVLVKLNPTLK